MITATPLLTLFLCIYFLKNQLLDEEALLWADFHDMDFLTTSVLLPQKNQLLEMLKEMPEEDEAKSLLEN